MTFKTGQKNVAASGVRVAIGAGTVNSTLIVRAKPTNTQTVMLGDVTVSSISGFIMSANEAVAIDEVGKLEDVYVVSDFANQGVSFITASEI